MYLSYTQNELAEKFRYMSGFDIVKFLMKEGLALKALDFINLPDGIYRRKEGIDLINLFRGIPNPVDVSNVMKGNLEIVWTLVPSDGEWWVQVLNDRNEPVVNGAKFLVDSEGVRLA